MNKLGILTFNRAHNYGALLQAYALKKYLSSYAQTEIINYQSPYIENLYKAYGDGLVKGIMRSVLFGKRSKIFKSYISDFSTAKIYSKETLKDLEKEYKKIIVGSDQVWNYDCSGGDEFFLLPGVKSLKYSYGASFGKSTLPKDQAEYFKNCLSDFRLISVREKTGKVICEKQIGIPATVVLDPTLLLNTDDWRDSLGINRINKRYVLVYSMKMNKKILSVANNVSKQLGLPVYSISVNLKNFFGDKVIRNASPKEWVELFYNAEFVVTDSFHGTAFSINFNKPFYSYAENERASRIFDLLDTLNLKDRLNVSLDSINLNLQIDYTMVNALIDKERKKSVAFIEEIIND